MSERSERIIVTVRSAHGCTVWNWNMITAERVHQ